jgi:uroporphyrinogen decarboxylase
MQFAPLSFLAQIRGLVKSMQDLILFPDLVHAALRAITETVIEFFREAIRAGATVLLYHNAREDYSLLTKRQVEEFGWRYDSVVLKEIRRLGVPVVLHMCGPEPMIDLVIAEYPKGGFKGIQFWDRGSNINIREAKEKFGDKVCLVAGFDNVRTINFGSPGDVEREVEEAITAAGEGGGLIISSGCEIPPNAPEENVRAVARAVERYGRYPLGKIRRL